ncbi:hypothetical protein ABZ357_05135 [Streptomyces sp. NPDC005917]|uniref:hypothetical protein n=1 Tax=unclassified Streptomyces TaxID=2593676 RepID=UPI0033F0BDDB
MTQIIISLKFAKGIDDQFPETFPLLDLNLNLTEDAKDGHPYDLPGCVVSASP